MIYKYVDAETALLILNTRTLRFTPQEDLNDPWEMDPNTWRFPRSMKPGETIEPDPVDVQLAVERMAAIETEREKFGVLSLTWEPANLPMWATYGDGHRGVVLGFDPAHEFFDGTRSSSGLIDVAYEYRVPDVFAEPSSSTLREDPLTKKSVQFAHEKEARVVRSFEAGESVPLAEDRRHGVELPAGLLQSVLVGPRTSEEELARLRQSLERFGEALSLKYAHRYAASYDIVFLDSGPQHRLVSLDSSPDVRD